MNFGDVVKNLRKTQLGLKQYEFAEKVGINKSYLCLVEKNVVTPSLEFLKKISDKCGIPLPVLIFKAIDYEDLQPSQAERFNQLKPTFNTMFDAIFLPEIK